MLRPCNLTMHNKASPIFTCLCLAAIGCYATIAQVILIREFLNIFYGNELCLGIVFGAWFFGIATGAFAGAKLEHTFKNPIAVFTVALLVMCAAFPIQIVSIRGVRSFLHVGIGEYVPLISLLLSSFGLIIPFSFIIGFIFPFSSLVVRGTTRDAALDVGVVYIVESMGSLIGGLLFSFYLVSRFHPFKIITILNGIIFCFLTIITLSLYERKKRWYCYIPLGLLLVMIVLWFSSITDKVEESSAKRRWYTLNPHIELITSSETKYQHIDIGKQADQYSIYLNGQYGGAFPNEYEYAQIAHLMMTQHPLPKHVLLIGSGLGGLISEILLHPIETLDYVELDRNLLITADKYLMASDRQSLSDKRVTIFHQDGRYYVKNTPKKHYYDMVLINTPDPSTAFLNRFYTREFFKEAQTILKPDGVLAASVSSAVTYIGKEVGSYTGSLYRTLHETFRNVLVTPGQTNFYFGCNQENVITFGLETLMERYRQRHIKSAYFTEYLFYTFLQPEQVEFIESQLSQRKDLLINTDAKPVTYFLNLILWDSLTGGHLHGLFYGLEKTGLMLFLVLIIMVFAGRILCMVLKQSKSQQKNIDHTIQLKTNGLITLATTGFTGIALEIVILYAFQNIYGYIYERMGVIVAVFMVGLALGGYISNKIILKTGGRSRLLTATDNKMKSQQGQSQTGLNSRRWVKILIVLQGVIGVYALILPFIISILYFYSTIAEIGLIFFIGIAGILTGLEFPLVNKIFIQSRRDIAMSAGATDSADHVGAFFGAMLTGVILLPILGVLGTCIILAVLNISSLVLLAFSITWSKNKLKV